MYLVRILREKKEGDFMKENEAIEKLEWLINDDMKEARCIRL